MDRGSCEYICATNFKNLCVAGYWFRLYFFLRPFGVHHLGLEFIFCAVLLSVIAAILCTNADTLQYFKRSLSNKMHIYLLFFLYGFISIFYRLMNPALEKLEAFPNAHFAHMAFPYVVTKTFDITFQQLAFSMFVFDLLRRNISMMKLQICSALLLSISHLATLTSLPLSIACVFIAAAALAGLVFPLAIAHKRAGFVVAFSLHWAYYLGMGIFYNLYFGLS